MVDLTCSKVELRMCYSEGEASWSMLCRSFCYGFVIFNTCSTCLGALSIWNVKVTSFYLSIRVLNMLSLSSVTTVGLSFLLSGI